MTQTPESDKTTQPDPEHEPEVEVEMIKDLDVDESQVGEMRGGQSVGGTRTGPTH